MLESLYYDRISFEPYEVSDIRITENDNRTTTVELNFNGADQIHDVIASIGIESYTILSGEQVYTVVLDEDMYMVSLKAEIKGSFEDENGIIYYIDAVNEIKNFEDADLSVLIIK